ncbi:MULTISPECIES: hypothetical protein [Brevibacillus]|uniref:hypothetical protein n=1 Tax=Brevibacillus TaxID=55080 RepID=UPI000D110139|nr:MULTISPECIES: hypothetical protein [Brevibacillus]MED1946047.1 hypothetical protein [Brevibacillus formosus]MED1997762.1 hypothetical protein [Brevibacillus formosus]MED2083912.1 hypothetical protein [Brevibacillus formosus]PSK17963.1 hypothetical protein C7R94_12335 [Brevibacillus sp. NRRL NRS-603]
MNGTNLCEVCNKREHTRLCDYEVGSGIVTSVDFQELTETCDKKMCDECAVVFLLLKGSSLAVESIW